MQQKSELPEGWAEAVLDDIGKWSTGGTPSRQIKEYFGGDIPWVKSGDLNDSIVTDTEEKITKNGLDNSSAKLLPEGTVSVALYGATIGKLGILNIDAATNQACANCQVNSQAINRMFLFYYLLSQREELIKAGQGGAQPNITNGIVRNWPITVPPLPEQHRIVSAIEALFARLDATNEKLDSVLGILKKFRESVLAAACEGRLTEDWREKNQVKKESWSDLDFFNFCVLQRGYDLPISKRRDGPYPIMASSGILAYHDECKAFGPGVVVGRSGSTGKVHYIEEDYWPHNTTLFVKDFKENYPRFVYFFLINLNLEQYSASTAVPTLNRNNLRGIIVSIPSFTEQQEIVRRVDTLFVFADSIESNVAAAREKTEKLRQSILAKAFSGQLVETEAEIARREGRDYETAEVLIERIKAEKGIKDKKK